MREATAPVLPASRLTRIVPRPCLACRAGLSHWAPWVTVEDRWGALVALEALVVALAALAYNNAAAQGAAAKQS